MTCRGDPAVFVKRPIPEHLEILDVAVTDDLRIVEAVDHADTFDRLLFHAIHFDGLSQMGCLQDRR